MTDRRFVTVDGNEATANIAHLVNEVMAIYPITPSSNLGEMPDAWAAAGAEDIFGTVPSVVEMQSEAGCMRLNRSSTVARFSAMPSASPQSTSRMDDKDGASAWPLHRGTRDIIHEKRRLPT